ncbi:MAG: capsule biosynthesis protein [Anaerolineales bacterium]
MRSIWARLSAGVPPKTSGGGSAAGKPAAAPVASPSAYPDWPQLLGADWPRWQAALAQAGAEPAVLLATSVGGHAPTAILESLLAVALTLRGARVHILLCDESLPACLQASLTPDFPPARYAANGPQRIWCSSCFRPAEAMFRALGVEVHRLSELIQPEERRAARQTAASLPAADILGYSTGGIRQGEHALAGTLRYFARGDLAGEPQQEPILRRYFEAALLTTYAATRLLREQAIRSVSVSHGIYVPFGVVCDVARREAVPVSTWNTAYRKHCVIFSHGDTYHHTMLTEPTESWEGLPWNAELEAPLMRYLTSRSQGQNDWIKFNANAQEDLGPAVAALGVDFARPCIGLLTNVVWDAQLMYEGNAFSGMVEWVLESVRYFARRPELHLIIRAHPGEVRGTLPSRQPILDEIHREFPILPPNVFLIPPESDISTYAMMDRCNAVLIYATKTGVELASQGMPVIVAGEAWVRNKGITLDATSPAEYFALLDQLPLPARMSPAQTRRARMYAYHFFFRRMIPLPMLEPTGTYPPFRLALAGLDDLRPGASPGLDIICDGLLNGAPFVFPAEHYAPESEPAA